MKPIKWAKALLPTTIGFIYLTGNLANAALEEVVVTATKRSESLQEVPLSVSATTGEKLEATGIQDFDDIAATVPSLSMKSSGPGRTKLNLRGVSAATGFAPTVSYYIDEMPISTITSGSSTSFAQAVVSPKLFDLERVEVLRGPQGTLYGSSSMGGTVRLITAKPNLDGDEGKLATEVSSTKGGGLNHTINGMLNLALTDDVAVRIVGSTTDNDGFIDRVYDDGEGHSGKVEDVNTEETNSIRATLRYQLNEDTYIQPAYFTQSMAMDGKPNYDGPTHGEQVQSRLFDAAEPFKDDFTLTSLTIGSDLEDYSALVNFSKMKRDFVNVEDMTDPIIGWKDVFDYDSPEKAAFVDEDVSLEDETFEARISTNTDSDLQWLLGIYNKDAQVNANYVMQRGFEYVTEHGIANTNDQTNYKEKAIFGEVEYTFMNDFTLTTGLRYLDYDYRQHKEDWGLAYGAEQLEEENAGLLEVNSSDQEVNYRVTLSWSFAETSQAYITSSDATRPGGGNRTIPRSTNSDCDDQLNALGISGNPSTYKGDSVDNLELGLKMEPSDKLRINTSIYRIKWSDIQQPVALVGGCKAFKFIGNLGEAESLGFEAEVNAVLTDNLTMNAGMGYTKAEFTETLQGIVKSGDLLPDVPEMTATVSLDWIMPYANGEIFVYGSVSYVDETLELAGTAKKDVSGNDITSGNVRPDYTLVDLRIGYQSSEDWKASLFIDNVTDEEAIYTYNDAIVYNVEGYDRTVRNRPRTIGVSAQYNF